MNFGSFGINDFWKNSGNLKKNFEIKTSFISIYFPTLYHLNDNLPSPGFSFEAFLEPLRVKSKSSRFHYAFGIVSCILYRFLFMFFLFISASSSFLGENFVWKIKRFMNVMPFLNFASHSCIFAVNNRIIRTTNSKVFRWGFGGHW